MRGSIHLHLTLGINPRLTTCTRCGGPGRDLLLLGSRNFVTTYSCGAVVYGGLDVLQKCPKCGERRDYHSIKERRELGEYEKLPLGICAACEDEIAKHKQIVADGGVYWHCTECHREGVVIASSEMAAAVRAAHKLPAPEPCGIEFTKCVEHEPGHAAEPKAPDA